MIYGQDARNPPADTDGPQNGDIIDDFKGAVTFPEKSETLSKPMLSWVFGCRGGQPPKITKNLQGIPIFLEKAVSRFLCPEVVETIT